MRRRGGTALFSCDGAIPSAMKGPMLLMRILWYGISLLFAGPVWGATDAAYGRVPDADVRHVGTAGADRAASAGRYRGGCRTVGSSAE